MKARMNYCQVLGLNPFREDGYSDEDLERAIDGRYREWQESSGHRVSNSRIHILAENMGAVADMRAVMANRTLRKTEFENARNQLSERASHIRTCAVVTADGRVVVIPSLAEKLVESLRWDGITVDDICSAAGISRESPPSPVPFKISNAFEAIYDLGFHTPYEFVNHILKMPALMFSGGSVDPADGPDAFLTAMDMLYEKRDRFERARMVDAGAYIAAIMELHSLRKWKDIETLMRYGLTYRDLEPAMRAVSLDGRMMVDAAKVREVVSTFVAGRVEDEDLAVEMLERFCFDSCIPADFRGGGAAYIHCPRCAALVEGGDRIVYCPVCGSRVRTVCPRCGRVQKRPDGSCSECGADLESSEEEARAVCGDAEAALAAGDLRTARALSSDLASRFPRYGGTEAIARKVEDAASAIDALRAGAEERFRAGMYHGAFRMLSEAADRNPSVVGDPEVRSMMEVSRAKVEEADALCGAADDQDRCISAAMVCVDHPGATAFLAEHPPDGPGEAGTGYNPEGIAVYCIRPADCRGLTFCFYRGYGAPPEINSETVPSAESDIGYWLDTGARPGAEVYYTIRTRRWGVYSESFVSTGPAVLVREVTNVSMTQLEDGIRADFEKPAGCVRVDVWRKRSRAPPATEEVPVLVGDGFFEDRGLDGGERYAYLFVAEYPNGVRSYGSVFAAETVPLPEPVDDLSIIWDASSGVYTATWSSRREVSLFASQTRPEFETANVPLSSLSGRMTEIEAERRDGCEAEFRLPRYSTVFVTPVIKTGATAVLGACVLIADPPPITDISGFTDAGRPYIRFGWPDGCTMVRVSNGDNSITIGRDGGEREGRIPVPTGDYAETSMSLSAIYPIDGVGYSSPAARLRIWSDGILKVSYSVRALRVQSDRGKREVAVTVSCPGASHLPQMVLVLAREGIPLRASDGDVVWRSDPSMILKDGICRGACFMDAEQADISRMRLFFRDRSEYAKYRVVHPLYRRRRYARRGSLHMPVLLQDGRPGQIPSSLHRSRVHREVPRGASRSGAQPEDLGVSSRGGGGHRGVHLQQHRSRIRARPDHREPHSLPGQERQEMRHLRQEADDIAVPVLPQRRPRGRRGPQQHHLDPGGPRIREEQLHRGPAGCRGRRCRR